MWWQLAGCEATTLECPQVLLRPDVTHGAASASAGSGVSRSSTCQLWHGGKLNREIARRVAVIDEQHSHAILPLGLGQELPGRHALCPSREVDGSIRLRKDVSALA